MRKLFTIILLLIAGPLLAGDRIASRGGDHVRISDLPCPYASVLRFIPEEQRKDFQKADSRFQGQRYFACWRNIGEAVHLIYEDGDQGVIPVSELKPVPAI